MLARSVRTAPAVAASALVGVLVVTSILAITRTPSGSPSLGAPDPATGPTVTIGMIIDGYEGAPDTGAQVRHGARIAVGYQNQYGDGLDGHRLAIRFCDNEETAIGGFSCATDMAQHDVAAVVEPSSSQGATEVPTLVHAGIPYITMTGGSAAELTTTGSFTLQGGVPAILGAVALQAKQRGYSNVTLIIENTPTVAEGTQALGGIVFKAAGVGLNVLTADPNATNLQPELRSAITGGASAVGVDGHTSFCRAFLKAYGTLHLHIPRYVIATCLGPGAVDSNSLDGSLKGSLLAGAETPSPRDDALYAAIVGKFAPSLSSDPNVSAANFAGLIPVLSLASIMKGAPSWWPVTPAGILTRTETATNVHIPLSGGTTFTCNGRAIPLLKSVCSAEAAIGVLGSGYRVTHVRSYDPTPLY